MENKYGKYYVNIAHVMLTCKNVVKYDVSQILSQGALRMILLISWKGKAVILPLSILDGQQQSFSSLLPSSAYGWL